VRPLDALRRRTHLSGGQFKYIFQIKYTAAVLSNSTRKLLWFKITKMLIAVKKLIYCVICCNFAVTRSFPTVSCSPSVCVWSYDSGVSVRVCVCVCRIVAAQLSDTGKYVCVAYNSLSRVLVGAELTVQGNSHTHSHISYTALLPCEWQWCPTGRCSKPSFVLSVYHHHHRHRHHHLFAENRSGTTRPDIYNCPQYKVKCRNIKYREL